MKVKPKSAMLEITRANGLRLYVERKEDDPRNRAYPNGKRGVVVQVVTAPGTHVTIRDLHQRGICLEDIKSRFNDRKRDVMDLFYPGAKLVSVRPKDSYSTPSGDYVLSWLILPN